MRIHLLVSLAMLPLMMSASDDATQKYSGDQGAQPMVLWGEDAGSNSYLGVDVADVTTDRLGALKLKEEKGAEVTMVDQDAPAGKAGIKEHDVILTMNGAPVESAAQLRRMIHETPAGRVITLGLSRDGQLLTVKVQLSDRQKEFAYLGPKSKDFHFVMPEVHVPEIDIPPVMIMTTASARSGLTVENLTPQLGEFFGVKNGNGVLVREVEKGSKAEKAGFRAGDVIVKINDEAVHDTSDFTHAVHSRKGDAISIDVMRDRKEQNLKLPLPERKDSGYLFEEESLGSEPLFNAESVLELSELQDKVAELQPDIELAQQQVQESSRKAMEEVRKALREEQQKFRKDSEKWQRQFREDQQKREKDLEKMMYEFRRNWMEL